MSKQDLDNSIHRFERSTQPGFKVGPPLYASTELPPEETGEALCFDIRGEWTPDVNKCAAKRVQTDRTIRYFVKWCTDGPDKGHPLNPYSVYYREGDDVRVDNRRGRMRYEFRKVNEKAFNFYLKFLKTRQATYCQAAEREALDA